MLESVVELAAKNFTQHFCRMTYPDAPQFTRPNGQVIVGIRGDRVRLV
jgi:hypothetical protein